MRKKPRYHPTRSPADAGVNVRRPQPPPPHKDAVPPPKPRGPIEFQATEGDEKLMKWIEERSGFPPHIAAEFIQVVTKRLNGYARADTAQIRDFREMAKDYEVMVP